MPWEPLEDRSDDWIAILAQEGRDPCGCLRGECECPDIDDEVVVEVEL